MNNSRLEEILQYEFNNKELLQYALNHGSYCVEHGLSHEQSNQRLEFLGDAYFDAIISSEIYRRMHSDEGKLSRTRAAIVCENSLASVAERLGIGNFLNLGKGEDNTGGRDRDSIISDVFEALIGAIYLDGGLDKAKCFIQKYVLTDMEKKIEFVDSKTRLQEKVQAVSKTLEYVLVSEEGPAHDKKYTIDVYINGEKYGTGIGRSKKSAEQHAAYEALKRM